MKQSRRCLTWAAFFALAIFTADARAAIDFTQFHTPAQMESEINNLAAAHPSLAQTFTIGNSLEGLPIRGIKISQNVGVDDPDKGDVVFIGLHHAREWISGEMALYLAEYLLTHYATDPALQACMNNVRVWIIPVSNPDGYVYTAASPSQRFWRKNRRNNGDGTFGVDLNRNFGYQWGLDSGSSPDTNSDSYRGTDPFSEPENVALRDFMKGLHNPRSFVTYHSFNEMVLRPWRYTTSPAPGDPTLAFIQQDSISRIAAVHGHTYTTDIGYTSSGNIVDWMWGELRIAAFTVELRPAFGGLEGFAPPPSEIIPTAEENLPAALALVKDAGCRTLWMKDYDSDTGSHTSAVWLVNHWSHAFWVSPDIWSVPAQVVSGTTATLNVRVRNDAGATKAGSIVRAYFTDPNVSLEFPNPAATLIGQQTLDLAPGETVVPFNWNVPAGTNSAGDRHWCVGVVVTHADDRPLTTQVQRSNNLACRNFYPVVGEIAGEYFVMVTNSLDVSVEYRMTVDDNSLPPGWRVVIPTVGTKRRPSRKARLLGVEGPTLEPGETIKQPVRIIAPANAALDAPIDIHVNGLLLPLMPGRRLPVGNGFTFRIGPREANLKHDPR